MIMRILRMRWVQAVVCAHQIWLTGRQGTQEFLAQQIQTISVIKLENPKKGKSLIARR
jgi:hypothetical protein